MIGHFDNLVTTSKEKLNRHKILNNICTTVLKTSFLILSFTKTVLMATIKNTKKNGDRLFDEYFRKIYENRWPFLKEAILNNYEKVMRENLFYNDMEILPSIDKDYTVEWKVFESIQEKNIDNKSLRQYYIMDLASIIAAEQLNVNPQDFVLDMCAAPGGKALILAEKCYLSKARLQINELSQTRRMRLKRVFDNYIEKPFLGEIKLTGFDAGLFGKHNPQKFDKILLDTPCSSEAHLLLQPTLLKDYKPKRSVQLAKRQFGLLVSAWDALKPKGTILYSTCSISPLENDGVIERLLERVGDKATIKEYTGKRELESTQYGNMILPDKLKMGPIYFSVIEKR